MNPFSCDEPVSPEQFVGRQGTLQQLREQVQRGASSLLVGEPRSGKTSLRNRLAMDLLEPLPSSSNCRLVPCKIDAQTLRNANPADFWRLFLGRLDDGLTQQNLDGIDVPLDKAFLRNDLDSFLRDMRIRRRVQPVLLIDEFDELTVNSAFSDSDIFGTLRELASHRQLPIMACSRYTISKLDEAAKRAKSGSPFFNFLTHISLEPMSRDEIMEIVDAGLRKCGYPIRFGQDHLGIIQHASGGLPFIAQALARSLFDKIYQNNNIHDLILYTDIGKRLHELIDHYIIDLIRRCLTPQESLILTILSYNEIFGSSAYPYEIWGHLQIPQYCQSFRSQLATNGFITVRRSRTGANEEIINLNIKGAVYSIIHAPLKIHENLRPFSEEWYRAMGWTFLLTDNQRFVLSQLFAQIPQYLLASPENFFEWQVEQWLSGSFYLPLDLKPLEPKEAKSEDFTHKVPTQRQVRQILHDNYRTDGELRAFIQDYFPRAFSHLTPNTNQTEMLNVLFSCVKHMTVYKAFLKDKA